MEIDAVSRLRPTVSSCNDYLTCGICHGYLVDAMSNSNCHHSFCRSCVQIQLSRSKFCPVCKSLANTDTLLMDLRYDRLLQKVVYKIVPYLFQSELQRRMEFVNSLTDGAGSGGDAWRRKQTRSIRLPRNIYAGSERISLCLVRCDSIPFEVIDFENDDASERDLDDDSISNERRQESSCQYRYLLCPVALTIGHLKKYIRFKYDMDETFEVKIFHSDESLLDEYSLIDVAYIYSKVKVAELTLYYVVFDSTTCKTPPCQETEFNNNSNESSRNPKRKLDLDCQFDSADDFQNSSDRCEVRDSSHFKKSRHQRPSIARNSFDSNSSTEPVEDSHLKADPDDHREPARISCLSPGAPLSLAHDLNINTQSIEDGIHTSTSELLMASTATSPSGCTGTVSSLHGSIMGQILYPDSDRGVKERPTDVLERLSSPKSISCHLQMASEQSSFHEVNKSSEFLDTDDNTFQINNCLRVGDNTQHWLTRTQTGVVDGDVAILSDNGFPASETDPAKDSDTEIDTEIRRIAANVAISNENSMTDYGINEDSGSALPSPYPEPSSGCNEEEPPRSIMDSIAISQLFAPSGSSAGNVAIPVGNFLIQNGPGFEYLASSERTPQTTTLSLENMTLTGHDLSQWTDYVDQMQQQLTDSSFQIVPTSSASFPVQHSVFSVCPGYSDVTQKPCEQKLLSSDSIVDCLSAESMALTNLVYSCGGELTSTSAGTCSPAVVAVASELPCNSGIIDVAPIYSCSGQCDSRISRKETVDGVSEIISKYNAFNHQENETGAIPEISVASRKNGSTPTVVECVVSEHCPSSDEPVVEESFTDGKRLNDESAKKLDSELVWTECGSTDISPSSISINCHGEPSKSDSIVRPVAPVVSNKHSVTESDLAETSLTNNSSKSVAVAVNILDPRQCPDAIKHGNRDAISMSITPKAPSNGSDNFVTKTSNSPSKSSKSPKSSVMSTVTLSLPSSEKLCESRPTVSDLSSTIKDSDVSMDSVDATKCNNVITKTLILAGNDNHTSGKEINLFEKKLERETPVLDNPGAGGEIASDQTGSKISVGTQTNIDLLGRYFKRRVNPVSSYLCGKGPRTGTTNNRERYCKTTKPGSSPVATSKTANSGGLTQNVAPVRTVTSQATILLSGHGTPILFPAVSPVTINGKSTILITVPGNFSFPNQNGLRPNMALVQTRLNYPRSTTAQLSAPLVLQHRTPSSQAMMIGRAVGPPLQLLIPSANSSVMVSDVSKDARTPVMTTGSSLPRSGYTCRVGLTPSQHNGQAPDQLTTSCQVSGTAEATFKQNKSNTPPGLACSSVSLSAATLPTFVLSSEPVSSLQNQSFCVPNTRPEGSSVRRSSLSSNAKSHGKGLPTSTQLASTCCSTTSSCSACSSTSSTSVSSTGLPKLSGARHISISNIPHVGNKFSVARKDSDQKTHLSSASKSAAITLASTPDIQATSLLFTSAANLMNHSPSTSASVLPSSSSVSGSSTVANATSDIRVSFQLDAKSGSYSQRIEGAPVSLIRAILERNLVSPYDTDRSTSGNTRESPSQEVSDSNSLTVHESTANKQASGKQNTIDGNQERIGKVSLPEAEDVPSNNNKVNEILKSSDAGKFPEKIPHIRDTSDQKETGDPAKGKLQQKPGRVPNAGDGVVNGKCLNGLMSSNLLAPASGVVTRSQRSFTGRYTEDSRCPTSSSTAIPSSPLAVASRRRTAVEANIKATPGGLPTKKKRRNSSDTSPNASNRRIQDPENLDLVSNPVQSTPIQTKPFDISIHRCPIESNNSVRRSGSQNSGTFVKPPLTIPGIFTKKAHGSEGATSPSSTAVGCCGQLPDTRRLPPASTAPVIPASSNSPSATVNGGIHPSGHGNGVTASGSSSDGPSKPGWASMAVQTRSGKVALPKKVYTYFGSALSHEHIAAREKGSIEGKTASFPLPKDGLVTGCENGRPLAVTEKVPVSRTSLQNQSARYLKPNDDDLGARGTAPPINQLKRMCSYIQNGRRDGASSPVDTELLPPRLSPFT